MADIGHEGGLLAARMVGATAGAWVSLVYLLPESWKEAVSRFLTGACCGVMFGAPAGIWLSERLGLAGHLTPFETALSGSAAASLSAWWALGALVRVASRLGAKPDAGSPS